MRWAKKLVGYQLLDTCQRLDISAQEIEGYGTVITVVSGRENVQWLKYPWRVVACRTQEPKSDAGTVEGYEGEVCVCVCVSTVDGGRGRERVGQRMS